MMCVNLLSFLGIILALETSAFILIESALTYKPKINDFVIGNLTDASVLLHT